MYAHRRLRSACADAQSNQSLLWVLYGQQMVQRFFGRKNIGLISPILMRSIIRQGQVGAVTTKRDSKHWVSIKYDVFVCSLSQSNVPECSGKTQASLLHTCALERPPDSSSLSESCSTWKEYSAHCFSN